MRIAYISQFADMVGGGEHSLLDLMTHLPEGYEPQLCAPSEGLLTRKAHEAGIGLSIVPMPKVGLGTLFVLGQWVSTLRSLNPDVIHANQSRAALYAGLAGKWLGIPVIFHCRIANHDGWMDKLLMALVDMIICNSQAVSKRFVTAKVPVQVVYNGIEFAAPVTTQDLLPDAEKLLLFVGRISEEKQVESLLAIFDVLVSEDASLHLAIVGDDAPDDVEYGQGLRDFSTSQPWAKQVHWLGRQDDVAAWYARADILLLTSKHEGFGRVLVEAMAEQLPVVAFAVGGVPEVFDDGVEGILVRAGDKEGMLNACRTLLAQPELCKLMGKKGLKRAQTFSIAKHVQQIKACYAQLLEDKG